MRWPYCSPASQTRRPCRRASVSKPARACFRLSRSASRRCSVSAARYCASAMAETTLPVPPLLHIGIALFPQHACEPERLLHMAQLAVSGAAEATTSRVEMYDPARAGKVLEPWSLGDAFVQ